MNPVTQLRPRGDPAAEADEGCWARFKTDVARYFQRAQAQGMGERLRVVATNEALWAIAIHRFGRWLHHRAPPSVRWSLRLPFAAAQFATRLLVGVYLDPAADIGGGLYIGHSGGIWVAPGAVIGRTCNINHAVTIGVAGRADRGVPRIGDRVWIGTKATLAGNIEVGSGAVISANSLVTSNVPENAVVIGVPARILGYFGSASLL
ncbi:MAG: hypothetical protein QM765_04595 [Myxococcales bacterium]